MSDLDPGTYARVQSFSRQGDALLEQGRTKEAIDTYVQALSLLPDPIHSWEAATWLFAAIGDTYWKIQDYERANKALDSALRSPGGIGNPFVHLRMGQVQYELGDRESATDELLRAYMGAGTPIFDGEDLRYLQLIAHLI